MAGTPAGSITPDPRQWLLVGIVFTILGIVTGLTFYTMAVLIDQLTVVSGFSITTASLGVTVSSLAGGIGGLWAARLVRRYSTRLLLLAGAIVGAAALCGVGFAHEPWQLFVAFSIFGIAMALMGNVPCTDLIVRSFHPRPAKAITIATTGMSMGGAVTPPIVSGIITSAGFRTGTMIIGAALVAFTALAVIGLREPPRLSAVAGANTTNNAHGSVKPKPRPLRKARRSPRSRGKIMLLLMIAFALLIFSQVATATHILSIARERNIGGAELTLVFIGVASLVARFVGIGALARVNIKWFALAVTLLQVVSQIVFSGADSLVHMLLGSALLGATVGNIFVLSSLYVLAGFELFAYASNYAVVGMAMTVGAALGPLFLGAAASLFGSYTLPLISLGIVSLAGSAVLFATGINNDPRGLPIT